MSLDKIIPEGLEDLLKRCLEGERVAQEKLYHLYADKMMGVCMWYSRNREEAEEVLQDGFVRVFTYLPKYRGQGSFEGWIRKIMVNASLARHRKLSKGLLVLTEYVPEKHTFS